MFDIDISSDIEDAMKDVDDFFYGQIPFTIATAMNDTMFDVKSRIVTVTYNNAFNVRNSRFPNILWRVDKIITGGKYSTSFRAFKGGQIDNMFVTLRQRTDLKGGDRGWTENHVTGGVKTPRGSSIAIPKNGDDLRAKNGRIRKPNKPSNITNKKDHFLMRDKAGRKRFIAKRTKGSKSLEIKYTFVKSANIKAKFRFYEDAFDEVERKLGHNWSAVMSRVINKSRFHPG
jgi:hypothetical protein